MQTSETLTELLNALLSAQAEFSVIPKDSENPYFSSKYASLPDIVQATTPILSKHGLGVTQLVTNIDGQDALQTMLFHSSGQYISSTAMLRLIKNDPQAHGSAITYMRRYSFMSILGLVADADDDGNAASYAPSAKKAQPASQPSLGEAVASAAGKPAPAKSSGGKMATEPMTRAIWAITHKTLGMNDVQTFDAIDGMINRRVASLNDLTFDEARVLIENFKSQTEE